MAPKPSGSTDVFNVDKIRELVELMKEHDLSVLDVRQGDQKVRLRRGAAPLMPAMAKRVGYVCLQRRRPRPARTSTSSPITAITTLPRASSQWLMSWRICTWGTSGLMPVVECRIGGIRHTR